MSCYGSLGQCPVAHRGWAEALQYQTCGKGTPAYGLVSFLCMYSNQYILFLWRLIPSQKGEAASSPALGRFRRRWGKHPPPIRHLLNMHQARKHIYRKYCNGQLPIICIHRWKPYFREYKIHFYLAFFRALDFSS